MIATTLLSFDTYTAPESTTEHGNLYYIVLAISLVLRFIAIGRLAPKNGLSKNLYHLDRTDSRRPDRLVLDWYGAVIFKRELIELLASENKHRWDGCLEDTCYFKLECSKRDHHNYQITSWFLVIRYLQCRCVVPVSSKRMTVGVPFSKFKSIMPW